MTVFEKWIQGITAGIAGLTFVWGIISIFIIHRQNKSLAILQGKAEKGIYVSKTVFDRVFLEFQKISKSLFENYNNACNMASIINEAECFDSKHSYIEKILEYREESKQAINAFVELICVNQFIIPDNLLSDLQKFEHEIKDVFIMYNDEKNNIINDINKSSGA